MILPNLIIDGNGVLKSASTGYQPVEYAPLLVNQPIPSSRFGYISDNNSSIMEVMRFALTRDGRIYDISMNRILEVGYNDFVQVIECEAGVNLVGLRKNGDLINIIYHDEQLSVSTTLVNVRLILPHHLGSTFLVLSTNDHWAEVEIGTSDYNSWLIGGNNLPKFSDITLVRSGIIKTADKCFFANATSNKNRRIILTEIPIHHNTTDIIGFANNENSNLTVYIICNGMIGKTNIPMIGYINILTEWINHSYLYGCSYTRFIEYTMNEPGLRTVVDTSGIQHSL